MGIKKTRRTTSVRTGADFSQSMGEFGYWWCNSRHDADVVEVDEIMRDGK
jgi:hypothetical protein